MEDYLRIDLDHLEYEELTYELVLRGIPVSESIENQKRELRARMRNEGKNSVRVSSFRSVSDEYKVVPAKLEEIEINLNKKIEKKFESRLYHYLERVARANESDEVDRGNKFILLGLICEMIKTYFNRDISFNEEGFDDLDELGAVGGKNRTSSLTNPEVTEEATNNPARVTGTIPKDSRNITETNNPLTTKFQNKIAQSKNPARQSTMPIQNSNSNPSGYIHISQIEDYIMHCVTEMMKENTLKESLGNPTIDDLAQRLFNSGLQEPPADKRLQFPIRQTTDQIPNQTRSVIPNNLQMPESVRRNVAPQIRLNINRSQLGDRPEVRRETGSNINPLQQNQNRFSNLFNERNYSRRQPHQTCNIVEKWPKFLGDSNPVPLVAFLRNIDILCRSYGIEKNELIRHAHLLFGGDASIWYTTYVDKFADWEALVYYLTLRYDNPNRDRFIKEEMRNRKQKPNELFSAFLTDIEALAQRLIHKMSEEEKFEIIIDNMKMSYKRRLALHELGSIEELANMCYRFDALENSLYTARNKPYEVHNLDDEYEQETESEEINILQKSRSGKVQDNTDRNDKVETPGETLCWNCRDYGHFWKDCTKQKSIFCHVCGIVGKTTSTCPKNHPPFKPRSENSKNWQRDGA